MINPSCRTHMSLARAGPDTRSFVTRAVTIVCLGIALAIPGGYVLGMPDAGSSQQRPWLPTSSADGFSGEILYEFDTALNKTTARFVASLGPRSVLRRLLLAAPEVHTLVATY